MSLVSIRLWTKLTRHGNSKYVLLPKRILDFINLDDDITLTCDIKRQKITIRKVRT